jgi:hypothetical protein
MTTKRQEYRCRSRLFAEDGKRKPEEMELILLGENGDEDLRNEDLAEAEAAQPSEWMVMKELLGINVFTYILAAAIIFFLSMNFVLGPGWLGSAMGLKGTGTFSEVSDSLPDTIDLSSPEFRL